MKKNTVVDKLRAEVIEMNTAARSKENELKKVLIEERRKIVKKNLAVTLGKCFKIRSYRGGKMYKYLRLIRLEENVAVFACFDELFLNVSNNHIEQLYTRYLEISYEHLRPMGLTAKNIIPLDEFRKQAKYFTARIYNIIDEDPRNF